MPTRLYFSPAAAAPVTPTAALPTGVVAGANMLVHGLVATKDSLANVDGYAQVTTAGGASQKVAILRYLYVIGATDFTGMTLKSVLRLKCANVSGDSLDNNAFGTLAVRILTPDGATVRGVVYAWTKDDVAIAPPANTVVQRIVAPSGTACAAVQALSGDLLEVIVGQEITATPSANKLLYASAITTGTDLAEVDATFGTNGSAPWIEFSGTIAAPSNQPPTIQPGTVVVGDQAARLTWPAAVSTAGNPTYQISRSTDGTNFTAIPGATGLTYLDTGRTNGQQYTWRMTVTDANGSVTSDLTGTPTPTVAFATNPKLVRSPGSWRDSVGAATTIWSGAYFRVAWTGTSLSMTCTPNGTVFRVSVDDGPWSEVAVASGALAIATGLVDGAHTARLQMKRVFTLESWAESSNGQLTVDRFTTTGSFSQATARSRRALVYGDSITEGLHAGAGDTNDASLCYANHLARPLDAEVGIIAKGGQGWTAAPGDASGIPDLEAAWNYVSSGHARDFSTPPDYVLIAHGTNDSSAADSALTTAINNTLAAMRAVMPTTAIVVAIPFGGYKRATITSAVQALQVSDPHLYLVDLGTEIEPPLNTSKQGPSYLATDGLHPDQYGHAVLGAMLAERIEAVLRVRELGGAGTITGTLNLQGGAVAAAGTMYAARVDTDAIVSQATVGADGSFTLPGLVVGQTYRVWGESVQGGVPWTAQPLLVAAA